MSAGSLSAVSAVAGLCLALSPITSYGDTAYAIHKRRSSAGFSLDVCAIMLTSSILKIYFYWGRPYEYSLYLQAWVMIGIQLVLLRLALQHRPPIVAPLDGPNAVVDASDPMAAFRPYGFWKWRQPVAYWRFLGQFALAFGVLQLILGWSETYVSALGFLGLAIEAVLPIPQILTIAQRQSVDGFRPTLLLAWLGGDVSKLSFFFMSSRNGSGSVAPQFIVCGCFQAMLDVYIGIQYFMYSTGRWKPTARRASISLVPRSD